MQEDRDDPENTDFNIEEYSNNYLNKEYKLKKLSEILKQKKLLKQQEISILASLGDPEVSKRTFEAMVIAHKGLLENEKELDVKGVLEEVFSENKELLEHLEENKNKEFYKRGELFNLFEEHPMQKKLKRYKFLGKRDILKAKSANSCMKTVHKAKQNWNKEKEDEDLRKRILLLELNAVLTGSVLSGLEEDLAELGTKVKDQRKLLVYELYTRNKDKITLKDLASLVKVDERTIRRWIKETDG